MYVVEIDFNNNIILLTGGINEFNFALCVHIQSALNNITKAKLFWVEVSKII